MKKKMRGFSLAELAVVLAVIGVMAVVVIPVFVTAISKAQFASAESDAYNTALIYEGIVDKPAEDVLLFVQTYSRFFVYSYSHGEVVAAENNQSRGYGMPFDELVDRYNYSCDDYSEMLMLTNLGEIDYAEAYGECFFRLSMTVERACDMTCTYDFVNLTSYVDEMPSNVLVYAGVLIGEQDLYTEQHSVTEDDTATTAILALLNRPDYNITYHNGKSVVLSTSISGLQGTGILLETPNYAQSLLNGERPGVKLSHGVVMQPPEGFPEYRFVGWSETENADEGFFTIILGRIHNINLYAVWTEG